MLGNLRKRVPECTTSLARKLYLTAVTTVTRKKPVTYVYRTIWLQGQYAVQTHQGNDKAMELIVDQIIEVLPYEPTASLIQHIRKSPRVTIVETF